MSDAIHASLREHITALEKEITALRLGRLVGVPEGLSEVGTTETRIDVSELLDEVNQLKREKYAAIQHLDEAQHRSELYPSRRRLDSLRWPWRHHYR